MLHAYQLRVQHPATLEDCCYTAQLPEDMRELLEGMTPEPGQDFGQPLLAISSCIISYI